MAYLNINQIGPTIIEVVQKCQNVYNNQIKNCYEIPKPCLIKKIKDVVYFSNDYKEKVNKIKSNFSLEKFTKMLHSIGNKYNLLKTYNSISFERKLKQNLINNKTIKNNKIVAQYPNKDSKRRSCREKNSKNSFQNRKAVNAISPKYKYYSTRKATQSEISNRLNKFKDSTIDFAQNLKSLANQNYILKMKQSKKKKLSVNPLSKIKNNISFHSLNQSRLTNRRKNKTMNISFRINSQIERDSKHE